MSKENPEFWSCDEDGQCIPELDDVVTDRISDGDIENGTIITVFGFDKEVITEKDKSRLVDRVLEMIYEDLDEDFEHPDCERSTNDPNEEITAKAKELVDLIAEDYSVTICRQVAEKKVRVLDVEKCTWEEVCGEEKKD